MTSPKPRRKPLTAKSAALEMLTFRPMADFTTLKHSMERASKDERRKRINAARLAAGMSTDRDGEPFPAEMLPERTGVCGTCGQPAKASAENEGYSYCCNDRIEYGVEATETIRRIQKEEATMAANTKTSTRKRTRRASQPNATDNRSFVKELNKDQRTVETIAQRTGASPRRVRRVARRIAGTSKRGEQRSFSAAEMLRLLNELS